MVQPVLLKTNGGYINLNNIGGLENEGNGFYSVRYPSGGVRRSEIKVDYADKKLKEYADKKIINYEA